MKTYSFLATVGLFFGFSALHAQSADQIKVSFNKQTHQIEILQKTDGKNLTTNYNLQRAEMQIFADGDNSGSLEIKNTWLIPEAEFEKGEIVRLEDVELLDKNTGAVIKLNGGIQVYPF